MVNDVTNVSDLSGYRFLKRLTTQRSRLADLAATTHGANNTLKGINEQLKKNVHNQQVLNTHLAGVVKQYGSTKKTSVSKPELALVVSNN